MCDVCGLCLSTRHALRTHALIHKSDTKVIPCKQCSKTFRHMQTYRKHVARMHEFTLDKRLACANCGKMYNHKEGLTRHVKKFHSAGAGRYRCAHCPAAAFAFNYELNRHTRRFHKGVGAQLAPRRQEERVLAEFHASTGGFMQIQ
jgi:KRAB domain-containing zinc finger protein